MFIAPGESIQAVVDAHAEGTTFVLKTGIPQGIVYANWSAFGIALVTLIGVWIFGDKISVVTGIGLVVVMFGIVLVQLGNEAVTH